MPCQITFGSWEACDRFGSMSPVGTKWLLLAALSFSSCCHINRLQDRIRDIKTVSYEVSVLERPTVRFTSHRSLEIRSETRSTNAEAELENTLAAFGGGDFAAQVLKQAAGGLGTGLGWALDESGGVADALLQIQVENVCFCAPDVQAEGDVKLALRVVLTENAGGEVLWRDCLDWTFKGLYPSLQQLGQADAAQREELLSDLAARMIERLAKHLATQAQAR